MWAVLRPSSLLLLFSLLPALGSSTHTARCAARHRNGSASGRAASALVRVRVLLWSWPTWKSWRWLFHLSNGPIHLVLLLLLSLLLLLFFLLLRHCCFVMHFHCRLAFRFIRRFVCSTLSLTSRGNRSNGVSLPPSCLPPSSSWLRLGKYNLIFILMISHNATRLSWLLFALGVCASTWRCQKAAANPCCSWAVPLPKSTTARGERAIARERDREWNIRDWVTSLVNDCLDASVMC